MENYHPWKVEGKNKNRVLLELSFFLIQLNSETKRQMLPWNPQDAEESNI